MELGPTFRAMTRNRARFVLIVLEVALTLALVVNCVTLILDARAKIARPSGFDEENLILVRTSPVEDAFKEEAYRNRVTDADVKALAAMPGVRAASHTGLRPWSDRLSLTALQLPGQQGRESVSSQIYAADPHLFETLGVELSAGRTFTSEEYEIDIDAAVVPAVVSQKLAETMFPDGGALGKKVTYPGDDEHSFLIVGIVDRFYKPSRDGGEKVIFAPGRSNSYEFGSDYLVRTEPGQMQAVLADIESTLTRVDAGRTFQLQTIPEMHRESQARNRVLIAALNAVMGLLLLVTALGIVGLTSFSVTERRRQIGTRRALGATRGDVVRYFLVENWLVTTCGVVLGAGLAIGLNIGLVNLVEGNRIAWPVLAAGVALLWLIGLASTLGPALRAAQVPPAIATRNV
jgi:putative ABC transport system permease protein